MSVLTIKNKKWNWQDSLHNVHQEPRKHKAVHGKQSSVSYHIWDDKSHIEKYPQ